ncbi:arsenite efflux MFS transporter ArsK [Phyllobacterium sp. YR531]|uniref:arsenite efflux MFS transporter ArsK n=1 Tax=Phyllobacterium sp. YR531 TaxID=1144343 RepID=UPI00026F48EF|nr:arsenite efflux MFS transporter ArsK [Phyllobacterium sp. YR531]EJN06483.1 arabinose efflux permease family protein [Phyllobacterium sp. YR531]
MIISARRSLATVVGLGITQIIGYGTLFYSFSIMAPVIGQEFGQTREWLFAAFSGTLLIGGIISPWSGRWADRFGAGRVMTFGSLAAALSLVFCALSTSWWMFATALITTGLATPFILYNTAFAVLVQVDPQLAPRRITYLTLMGGFSSTLFWPLVTTLLTAFTWREIFLSYALLQIILCLPIHFWLSQMTRRSPVITVDTAPQELKPESSGSLRQDSRKTAMILLATGFSLASFALSSMLVHFVPVLGAVGLGASAVFVGTMFGPAQFASRLINMLLGGRFSALNIAIISTAMLPLAFMMLLLPSSIPLIVGAILFAILFGMGSGLNSIVLGTLPLALFGHQSYGEILGKITSSRLIVSSVAPFVLAFLLEHFGPTTALVTVAAVGVLGVMTFITVARLVKRSS